MKFNIPWRDTLIISFGVGCAALKTLRAPTLADDVMKSPETLSSHWALDMPAGCFSNSILIYGSSWPNKQSLPSARCTRKTSSPGLNTMSIILYCPSYCLVSSYVYSIGIWYVNFLPPRFQLYRKSSPVCLPNTIIQAVLGCHIAAVMPGNGTMMLCPVT